MSKANGVTSLLTPLEKLCLRLAQFRGKAVTVMIAVDQEGIPISLTVLNDTKVELLETKKTDRADSRLGEKLP